MISNKVPDLPITADEVKLYMAEMKAKFTADDLYEYIEGSWEGIPAAEVLAKGDEIIRRKWAVDPESGLACSR